MTEKKNSVPRGLVLDAAIDALGKVVPDWSWLAAMQVFNDAAYALHKVIREDKTGELKKSPFIQLEYDTEFPPVAEDEGETFRKEVITEREISGLTEILIDQWPGIAEKTILSTLTKDVRFVVTFTDDPDKPSENISNVELRIPPELAEELQALPKADQGKRRDELAQGFDFSGMKFSVTETESGKEVEFEFKARIVPLVLVPDEDRSFFPIITGLDFTKGEFADLSDSEIDDIFKRIFKFFDDQAAAKGKGKARAAIKKPDRVRLYSPETFHVAAGFNPMHRLAERNRGGLPLFPEERRQFYELRTPLNWAVGLAFFARTSEKAPGDWQEVTLADLQSRVYSLTERQARRHGQQREDILAEVVKLHSAKNFYVRYEVERLGRFYRRNVVLGSDYAIPNLELVFRDRKGRRVYPSDPALQSVTIPLEVKGRRVYTPDGKDIKALPKDRFKLHSIRWRWNPSFVDDLKAAPLLDKKGRVMKGNNGRPVRGGYNIQVAVRIFKALATLRNERAYVAHDLLILLAHDIQRPPKQSQAARNIINREAFRLFDLLGLEEDPKSPGRREEVVAAAIYRLKQPDIGALLPGSDERPRPSTNPDARPSPFYHLIRSSDFMPAAALVTKEEAAGLNAEAVQPILPPPPKKQVQEVAVQRVLPGIVEAPPVPSGADIREARTAAGVNIRDFARLVKGGSFNTWARYERGGAIRAGKIGPETWQKVRDFVAKHKPKGGA
jgi:hypothetical protein